jgi:hypothetical protein
VALDGAAIGLPNEEAGWPGRATRTATIDDRATGAWLKRPIACRAEARPQALRCSHPP